MNRECQVGAAVLAGLILLSASGAWAQNDTTQVGEGFFQKTFLDILPQDQPDPDIARDKLALTPALASDITPLPTSSWFSSFYRFAAPSNPGVPDQNMLVTNPLTHRFGVQQYARSVNGQGVTFDTHTLFVAIPNIEVGSSANIVLPDLAANNRGDLGVSYGGSYVASQQLANPPRFELSSFDDTLSVWTASTANASLTLTAVQGSPFAYFEADNYPIYLQTSIANSEIDPGVAGLKAQLYHGTPHAYVLFYPESEAVLENVDFSASNRLLSFPGNQGHFVIAVLPFSLSGASLTPAQLDFIQSYLAPNTFNYPVASSVSYSFDPASGTIDTTFALETHNPLTNSSGGPTLLSLLPHHYSDTATADGKSPTGELLLQSPDTLVIERMADANPPWSTRSDGWQVEQFNAAINTPYDTNHANPYTIYGAQSVFYYATLGPMLAIEGTSFTVKQNVIGLLPWLILPTDEQDPQTNLSMMEMQEALLFRFMQEDGIALTQYLNNDNFDGNTYDDGKHHYSWARAAVAANQMGVENDPLYQITLETTHPVATTQIDLSPATDRALKKYFTQDPDVTWEGQTDKKRFFVYDNEQNSALGYPAGFGSTIFLNDHNLTYGYFAHTASILSGHEGFLNSEWLRPDRYGNVIDQLIYDVLNPFTEDALVPPTGGDGAVYSCTDGTCGGLTNSGFVKNNRLLNGGDPAFPFQRNYDAFSGIAWASGIVADGRSSGPNLESVSEALHLASGALIHGAQSGNKSLFVAALAQWVTMIHSHNAYWMDLDGYYNSFGQFQSRVQDKMGTFAANVFAAKAAQSNFFDTGAQLSDPEAVRGITMYPFTPHSFYLSLNKDYMRYAYGKLADYVKNFPPSEWNLVMSEWEASFDPDKAAIDLNNALQNIVTFDGGTLSGPAVAGRSPIDLEKCLAGEVTSTKKPIVQFCSTLTGIQKLLGNSFLSAYRWVQFNRLFGTADFAYTASSPFALVLNKGGTLTFAAYNPTTSVETLTFYHLGQPVPNLTNILVKPQSVELFDATGTPFLIDPTLLAATADSFIFVDAPHRNEGANPRLNLDGGLKDRVVVLFDPDDITGFMADGEFMAASLVLTIESNANNWGAKGQSVEVLPLFAPFTEGNGEFDGVDPADQTMGTGPGVTWNCATDADVADRDRKNCIDPWFAGAGGADLPDATSHPIMFFDDMPHIVSWDVTEDVLNGAFGWVIRKTNEGSAGEVRFFSRETATATGNPEIAPVLVLQ